MQTSDPKEQATELANDLFRKQNDRAAFVENYVYCFDKPLTGLHVAKNPASLAGALMGSNARLLADLLAK